MRRTLLCFLILLVGHSCSFREGEQVHPLRSCYFDSECFWDEYCSDFGWCTLMGGCRSDVECPLGHYCELDGTCVAQSLCAYDYDCPVGAYCAMDGSCRVSQRCLTPLDCPQGHECDPDQGVCYQPFGCQVHNDCTVGYSCGVKGAGVKNVCAFIAKCSVNTECPSGYYCAGSGFCYLNSTCSKDTECAPGTYCDYLGSQQCLPVKTCTVDTVDPCQDVPLEGIVCEKPQQDCVVGGEYVAGSYCTTDKKCKVPQYCDGNICRQGKCNSQNQCAPGLQCDVVYGVCVRP